MTPTSVSTPQVRRIAGALAIAGNVGGVLPLLGMDGAYRIGGLDRWAAAIAARPAATAWSVLGFVVGLVALAIWALLHPALGKRPLVRSGAMLMGAGAVLNAGAALAPLSVAFHLGTDPAPALARALLGLSISGDALFNLLLGAGLLLWSTQMAGAPGRRILTAVAGAASVPVAGQCIIDGAASWLAVSAPLWLAVIALDVFRPPGRVSASLSPTAEAGGR